MTGNAALDSFDSSSDDTQSEDTENGRVSQQESSTDEYGTPRWLIRKLTSVVSFDLDPAAGAEPVQIADTRYTKKDDGLRQDWDKPGINSIWLNPPYSDPKPFLKRLDEAVNHGSVTWGLALTKSDTSTGWFHSHITSATATCFLDDRLSFVGGADQASFANALSVFGDPPADLLDVLADLGELYSQVTVNAAVEQQRLDDILPDGGVTAVTALPVSAGSGVNTVATNESLDFVEPYERLRIDFGTDGLGVPGSVPESVEVKVLPDGKQIEPETGSIRIQTVGKTAAGEDVCVDIRNSADLASQLEVSVAVGMGRWQLATPTSIERVTG